MIIFCVVWDYSNSKQKEKTIQIDNLTAKFKKKEIKSPANPYRGFEQLGHEAEETTTFN